MSKYAPYSLLAAICLLPLAVPAQAFLISGVSISPTTISNETNLPNGTTITFTIDTPGTIQITVNKIQNVGDTGSTVATLTQTYTPTSTPSCPLSGCTQQFFWNGLWLINGELGRQYGTYEFSLSLSTESGTSPSIVSPQHVLINSVDIHNITVSPGFDSNGLPTFPYTFSYSLAKDSNVNATIVNSSGTLVRTLVLNKIQFSEVTLATNTVTWDGIGNDGKPVTIGLYGLVLNATDPQTGDRATTRNRSVVVQSLAGSATDPQKLFEDNVYVFPNPVRNGQGTFHVLPVREGGTIKLRIYTISGDLVFDKDISGQSDFTWNAVNSAGRKVGRGLYYYVVREEDAEGTLQTVKKLAVIP